MHLGRNLLFYGDNLQLLRNRIPTASVDLVYLDPPFNSNRSYNVLFRHRSGAEAQAQIEAFDDTWTWSQDSEQAYRELVEGEAPPKVADALEAMRTLLGDNDVLAYLTMMSGRLVELHRVLRPTGSLYLHCDPTASHYLKLLLDAVFGPVNFRNEIIWRRTGAHGKVRRFGPIHDVILFYTRSNDYKWNHPKRRYMKGHVREYFVEDETGWRTNYYGNVLTGSGLRGGESGRPWQGIDPSAKRRHWAIPGALLDELDEDLSELTQHQKLDRLLELGYIRIDPDQAWPMYERYITPEDGTRSLISGPSSPIPREPYSGPMRASTRMSAGYLPEMASDWATRHKSRGACLNALLRHRRTPAMLSSTRSADAERPSTRHRNSTAAGSGWISPTSPLI